MIVQSDVLCSPPPIRLATSNTETLGLAIPLFITNECWFTTEYSIIYIRFMLAVTEQVSFKGILHQKIFYCLNLRRNQTGPRGTAQNDKSLKCFISVAAPRNPMVLRLETPSCCASKPLRRP